MKRYIIHRPCNWKYLDDKSWYNNNFYQNPNTGEIVYEYCDEFANTLDFYLVNDNLEKIATLGSLWYSDMDWNSENDIELEEFFT
ncbi:MAG: hypothetical protein IJH39_05675 [Clostridia bacterium]|nr:hypothetical protein [Clostridia bacterium]